MSGYILNDYDSLFLKSKHIYGWDKRGDPVENLDIGDIWITDDRAYEYVTNTQKAPIIGYQVGWSSHNEKQVQIDCDMESHGINIKGARKIPS